MNVLDSVWMPQEKKDLIIKEIILTADFETAYYTMCKYITCRSLQPLHASIIGNVSNNRASMDLAPRGFGKSTVGDVDFCITRLLCMLRYGVLQKWNSLKEWMIALSPDPLDLHLRGRRLIFSERSLLSLCITMRRK